MWLGDFFRGGDEWSVNSSGDIASNFFLKGFSYRRGYFFRCRFFYRRFCYSSNGRICLVWSESRHWGNCADSSVTSGSLLSPSCVTSVGSGNGSFAGGASAVGSSACFCAGSGVGASFLVGVRWRSNCSTLLRIRSAAFASLAKCPATASSISSLSSKLGLEETSNPFALRYSTISSFEMLKYLATLKSLRS